MLFTNFARLADFPFSPEHTLAVTLLLRSWQMPGSFASVAASGGRRVVIIGNMLGHSQLATTARYAHLTGDPVKAGARIAAVMDAGTSGDVVNGSSRATQ